LRNVVIGLLYPVTVAVAGYARWVPIRHPPQNFGLRESQMQVATLLGM
jgi:hypothetical protein